MHSAQRDVLDFHQVLNIPIGETPADAIFANDLIEAIDGMVDILVVTYGTAVEFGIDLEPFWDEVHLSNMAKEGGPIRADGKVLKPESWIPPDIAGVFRSVYG